MADSKTKRRFYMPSEIATHSTEDDAWVSFLGKVYDITRLIRENRGHLTAPLEKAAGTDISHWFDKETGDIRTAIDEASNLRFYFTPQGRFVHIPPKDPTPCNMDYKPWWNDDESFLVGQLSQKTRWLKIINTLSRQEHVMEVCSEETLQEILDRFLDSNKHAASYTWKRLGKVLDLNKTLEENSIPDESGDFEKLGIPDDMYIPAVHLYYNDDLTEA
eukprot:TRINITY_DN2984_c0_g1_i1.p1 TRINITY_DN2984_c0_g1~~TRINITY_DN2984_c0_g1_i1.p1  ORF type:complete len:218 (-),score=34.01 TRINITY_DN2984_c0_g1_i1:36-689(-)